MDLLPIWGFALLALLVVLYQIVKAALAKSDDDKFDWQPDLTHNVLIQETPPTTSRGAKRKSIILVEKSVEERAEERRNYLKENQK